MLKGYFLVFSLFEILLLQILEGGGGMGGKREALNSQLVDNSVKLKQNGQL